MFCLLIFILSELMACRDPVIDRPEEALPVFEASMQEYITRVENTQALNQGGPAIYPIDHNP